MENTDVFKTKEVKEKNKEDIKNSPNSPLQEIEFQESINDATTKMVKSKEKISIKHKKNIKAKPKNKIPENI
jgi:hypothetical protein